MLGENTSTLPFCVLESKNIVLHVFDMPCLIVTNTVEFCIVFLGKTGHTEAVRVVYQPENIRFQKLLKVFWENHDPTQGRMMSEPVFNYLTNYSWDN